MFDWLTNLFKTDGKIDWGKILLGGAGTAGLVSLLKNDDVQKFLGIGGANTNQPVGYQGGIPNYMATRTQLPVADTNLQKSQILDWAKQYGLDPAAELAQAQKVMSQDGITFDQLKEHAGLINRPYTPKYAFPTRRPGSGGRRYFSDLNYTQDGVLAPPPTSTNPPAKKSDTSSTGVYDPGSLVDPIITPGPKPLPELSKGGLASLPQSRGYYLGGATDGMADKVPARIDGTQEARLSDGEFVLPADIVSHLGNGNSQAGAKVLYDMMDRVRRARTGTAKQGRQINPNKYTPV